METPIAIAVLALIGLAVFSVLSLTANTKRWKKVVERERATNNDLMNVNSRHYTSVFEAKQKLIGAETLAEQRRVRVVDLERNLETARAEHDTETAFLRERPLVRAKVTTEGKSYVLWLEWQTNGGTGGMIAVRTLVASKTNNELLTELAEQINKRTVA